MKQIEVQILQQSYLLTCPEGHESRLLDAVERVDTAMTRIRDTGKVRARERIAVLAALNLTFEVADREVADLAASAAAAAVPPATATLAAPDSDNFLNGADDQRLLDLVQRLDQILGNDDPLR